MIGVPVPGTELKLVPSHGKLEVRVLPDEAFGLIHGKAGVIRYGDGSATAFLGSVNESASAWKMNFTRELSARMRQSPRFRMRSSVPKPESRTQANQSVLSYSLDQQV